MHCRFCTTNFPNIKQKIMISFCRILAALVLLLPPALYAQDTEEYDLVTDRPDQTESALTVPPMRVQIEAGVEAFEQDGVRFLAAPSALVRVGIVSGLEFRLSGGYLRITDAFDRTIDGLGGVGIGAKVQLFGSYTEPLKGALIAEVAPPVGSEGLAPEGTDGAVVLCLANEFGPVALGANLGVELVEGAAPSGLYSLVYGSGIAGNVSGFLEVFGSVSSAGGPEHSFNVGTTFLLWPNFQIDLANAFPLSDAAPEGLFTAGISWRLPR